MSPDSLVDFTAASICHKVLTQVADPLSGLYSEMHRPRTLTSVRLLTEMNYNTLARTHAEKYCFQTSRVMRSWKSIVL